jgi:Leucine-rich repeat (LRR) protein
MKKDYCIIFIALCCFFNLNAQLDGTWRIASEPEALKVGPEPGSSLWWSNDEQTLIDRACYFDDAYIFNSDGSYSNVLGSETWLEPFQGVAEAQCGPPIFPHDGSANATYVYDQIAGTITLNGQGAYLGLSQATNNGNLVDLTNVPQSITYDVVLSDNNNVMTLAIEAGTGTFWTYKLISDELVVDITDSNFENYLETHSANGDVVPLGDATSMGDGVLNNLTLMSKVEAVTNLNVNDSNITSLQGIEAFINLESLYCQRNQLESLDVSQNLVLSVLECESNLFTSLDVSNNTVLRTLGCANNNLSSLDISNNLQLEGIWFTNNQIQSLNLDVNTALNVYGLSNNPLVYMSIKNGNNANVIYMEALNLPTLSCIQVDDENASTYLSANFSFVDESISFSEDCGTVYIPDNNFENYLETHSANGDVVSLGDATSMGDGVLNNLTLISKVEAVTDLNVNDSSISSLKGIEAFTSLEILYCQRNQLAILDISQNLALEILECETNQFSTLDVSSNTALKVLGFANNNLSSIDVSNNLLLEGIWFTNNNITNLNLDINTALRTYGLSNNPLVYMSIQNGNNANMSYIEAQNLPTLNCIQVDDENAAYLSQSNWFVDPSISFSNDCGTVYIPDSNFENYLETHTANGDVVALGDATSMGDGLLNNLTLISKVSDVTELYVSENNIASLQGIEAFTSLEILHCRTNQLETLDVSQNLALEELECESNQFSTLDVSNNNALRVLGCANNNLASIDVSNNLLLEALWFTNNNIASLNLDVNTALNVYGLSNNPLVYMSIQNGNNANMQYIEAQDLPTLTCIQVDDENAAYLSSWNVDSNISFSEDCGDVWTVYTTDSNLDSAIAPYLGTIDSDMNGLLSYEEASNYSGTLDLSNTGIEDITGLEAFTSVTEINLSGNSISDLSGLLGGDAVILTRNSGEFRTVQRRNFSALQVLNCSNNNLTRLDVSIIESLISLDCSNNQLEVLNVKNGNNASFINFDATDNPGLYCALVDDAASATSNWISKDSQTLFSDTDCNAKLQPKVFLQGAMINPNLGEETLMRDDLRALGYLPTISPYVDELTCDASVFTTIGNDAIVDWVFVELRDKLDNTLILDSKSALLQRDGDVVAIDGVSELDFSLWANTYYVTIKHRNHLAIMSNTTHVLNFIPPALNFSDGGVPTFGSNALVNMGSGNLALWAGDTNGTNKVNFTGSSNGSNVVKDYILADPSNILNFITYGSAGYLDIDVDMNGIGKFSGANNDSNVLKDNVLAHPANILNFITYTINTTVPE